MTGLKQRTTLHTLQLCEHCHLSVLPLSSPSYCHTGRSLTSVAFAEYAPVGAGHVCAVHS